MSLKIIDADQMMALLKKHHFRGIKEMVAAAPEIVRCKDCLYNENGQCTRSEDYDDTRYRPDYFCADGERRVNNGYFPNSRSRWSQHL